MTERHNWFAMWNGDADIQFKKENIDINREAVVQKKQQQEKL